jgi:hypothetical protein
MSAQGAEESGDFHALREVTGADAKGAVILTEFSEFFFVGVVVHAVNRGETILAGEFGDGFVGGQHEFFNELMAFIVLDKLEPVGVTLFVDENLGLRHL